MTIFHKAMLSGACEIAKVEKVSPVVLLEPDGSIAAINSWSIFATEPTHSTLKKSLPFKNDVPLLSPSAVSIEQLATLIKAIPPDRQFRSKLEHISIVSDGPFLLCEINGGKGIISQRIRAVKASPLLLSWRDRLRALLAGNEANGKPMILKEFVFNRKRLMAATLAIESACKYDGEFSYVSQSVIPNGYIWKALNELTGNQTVLLAHLLPGGSAPGVGDWEKQIFSEKKKQPIILKRRSS